MRIVHVTATLDPSAGGLPAVAVRLAAAQSAAGHRVEMVSHSNAAIDGDVHRSMERVPGGQNIVRHSVPIRNSLDWAVAFGSRRILPGIIRGADVVHIHGIWDPIVRWAGILAYRAGVPYVIAPHGMLDPWSLRQKRWKKKIVLFLAYRRFIERSAALHCLNETEKQLIVAGGFRCRYEVIPNGVFLNEIDPLPERGGFARRFPALQGRRFVLFLSRLHYKKGLDYLAEAFALLAGRFRDVDLVVAGPDGGAEADFRRQISQHQLAGRVHLVGPLYGPEKFEAIVDASCLCLPSRQEGFSIAITEALGCGTPVVISRQCNFPEVAASKAGIETELDAPVIAGALSRLLEDPELMRSMGRAGRALVEERFTWPKVAELTLDLYSRIVKKA
ncbi:MAG: glycosyltransferase [Tepidisphaeraceae bacterium]|jgi:glycosyltransferase involved in cell wall biosynthesis